MVYRWRSSPPKEEGLGDGSVCTHMGLHTQGSDCLPGLQNQEQALEEMTSSALLLSSEVRRKGDSDFSSLFQTPGTGE